MQIRNGKMSMVGSILVGGIVGAGLAFLFAPQSGKRTRRDLRHLGKKMLNKSEAIGMDLRNSVEHLVDDLADRVHAGLESGRDWAGRRSREVQGAVAGSKSYLQESLQKIRRAS